MSSLLIREVEGRVLILTIANEEKRNALNSELCHALVDTIFDANENPNIGSIVLTGRGVMFSSGMDLFEAASPNGAALTNVHGKLFNMKRALRKPLISAVQGPAYGGALGLIANSHYVVCGDHARFKASEIKVGLWPYVIYPSLIAAIGESWTTALATTARELDPEEALRIGLVHEVSPMAGLMQSVMTTAHDLGDFNPEAMQRGLAYVCEVSRLPTRDEQIQLALKRRSEALQTPEFQNSVDRLRKAKV